MIDNISEYLSISLQKFQYYVLVGLALLADFIKLLLSFLANLERSHAWAFLAVFLSNHSEYRYYSKVYMFFYLPYSNYNAYRIRGGDKM